MVCWTIWDFILLKGKKIPQAKLQIGGFGDFWGWLA